MVYMTFASFFSCCVKSVAEDPAVAVAVAEVTVAVEKVVDAVVAAAEKKAIDSVSK
jgi:hypothetical protein